MPISPSAVAVVAERDRRRRSSSAAATPCWTRFTLDVEGVLCGIWIFHAAVKLLCRYCSICCWSHGSVDGVIGGCWDGGKGIRWASTDGDGEGMVTLWDTDPAALDCRIGFGNGDEFSAILLLCAGLATEKIGRAGEWMFCLKSYYSDPRQRRAGHVSVCNVYLTCVRPLGTLLCFAFSFVLAPFLLSLSRTLLALSLTSYCNCFINRN